MGETADDNETTAAIKETRYHLKIQQKLLLPLRLVAVEFVFHYRQCLAFLFSHLFSFFFFSVSSLLGLRRSREVSLPGMLPVIERDGGEYRTDGGNSAAGSCGTDTDTHIPLGVLYTPAEDTDTLL